ncbi:MAG: hypothetical protein MRZ79_06705 [Bacteroidia bacterium]|nr:hypothetical protein [Bacteroidia bacterium]
MFSILLSSTGLVVNKHFCLEELQSVAFFLPATPCPMGVNKAQECLPGEISINKKSCCDDQNELFKLTEEADPSSLSQSLIDQELNLFWLEYSQENQIQKFSEAFTPIQRYKSPLIVCDVIIDIQTFLC